MRSRHSRQPSRAPLTSAISHSHTSGTKLPVNGVRGPATSSTSSESAERVTPLKIWNSVTVPA